MSRDLLRRAAKLDGQKPGEWVRLTVERAARERIARGKREAASARLWRQIMAGDYAEETQEEADFYDRLRHGGK
ncbi:MAG TPA: hypothetical protein VLT47_13990 [Anaeromyxobacteraceae bacterium]|nr:hypothetical protein [Anaeromyxobacteraceae bacterium]